MTRLAIVLVLFSCAIASHAQLGSKTDYLTTLKNVSVQNKQLRNQLIALKIDALEIHESERRDLLQAQKQILASLDAVNKLITGETDSTRSLGSGILILSGIDATSSISQVLMDQLPVNEAGSYWRTTLGSLIVKFAELGTPLQTELYRYANEVEDKAARCKSSK